MTDTAISPLRKRTEDMTVPCFTPGPSADLVAVRNLLPFLVARRMGGCGGLAALSASYEVMRGVGDLDERGGLGLALFLWRDAATQRCERGYDHCPRTQQATRRAQSARVARLLDAAPGLKYRPALSLAYGAGLRASEVVTLKVTDIDSERIVIRVEQGKGRKDRYAMLPPTLLDLLRAWWRRHKRGVMLPGGWLFPGQNAVNPLTTRQLRRTFHGAREAAGIDKRVSLDTSEGTASPRLISWSRQVDIRVIQVLLGHKKLDTTARYAQVASTTLRAVKSPLEHLKVPPA